MLKKIPHDKIRILYRSCVSHSCCLLSMAAYNQLKNFYCLFMCHYETVYTVELNVLHFGSYLVKLCLILIHIRTFFIYYVSLLFVIQLIHTNLARVCNLQYRYSIGYILSVNHNKLFDNEMYNALYNFFHK